MVDYFPLEGSETLRVTIEHCSSPWKQGIYLYGSGTFYIAEKKIEKAIALWHSTAPDVVDFRFRSNQEYIKVKNVWDTGNGCMESWLNWAAMKTQEIPSGRRYFCNDARANEDFTDIVFRLERFYPG